MISKERFIEILKFIQDQENKQNKFIEALELLSPGSYVDAFIYSEYTQVLIRPKPEQAESARWSLICKTFLSALRWAEKCASSLLPVMI